MLLHCQGSRIRYPEKTHYLGQVFNDTTNSYKLLWFLAILSLLKQSAQQNFPISDLLVEMAAAAWHPVCFFRLSFGKQDKLQDLVLALRDESGLPPNESVGVVRNFII